MAREQSGSAPARVFGRFVLYLSGFDPEEVYARQPDFASRPTVEPHHGVAPVAGDVADLAVTKGRGDAFSDGEIGQESLPQSGDVGERERAPKVGSFVAPVGNQDTRDAIEVRPADLRDETCPDRLPHELTLELRILLAAPAQYPHYPRVRPLDGLLDRQPVDTARVNVRVEPLLLPPPRDAQPLLTPVIIDLCHVQIIPRNCALSSYILLQN